jgi:hypothetical protein
VRDGDRRRRPTRSVLIKWSSASWPSYAYVALPSSLLPAPDAGGPVDTCTWSWLLDPALVGAY